MIQIIAVLAAAFSVSFAHADNNLVSHERFLEYKARFDAERPKKDCVDNLKPELIRLENPAISKKSNSLYGFSHGPFSTNDSELFGRDLPLIKYDNGMGVAVVLDPTDTSSDPNPILKVVKLIKTEKPNDYVVKIRKYGLLKFHYRMQNLHDRRDKFDDGVELKNYCELLAYSMKDIFYNNPEGQNPVAETFQHFATEDPNFHSLEHYKLLSAALAGIDLKKAMEIDPYFYTYIQMWYQAHHGSRSLSSQSDDKIDRKIRQIAPQFEQLKRLVSNQE